MNWTTWIVSAGLWATLAQPASAFEFLLPAPTAPTGHLDDARALAGGAEGSDGTWVFSWVNTASRETSRLFYRTVHTSGAAPPPVWTGNVATCDPGTTEPAYRDLVALRINYFRAMAGVPPAIVFEDDYSTKAQAAALIVSRNLQVNHEPPSDWACYTATGADAASKSVLAVGLVGPQAIDAYIEDFGVDNAEVGHRRWILYPQTQRMGSGDIPASPPYPPANATWVYDGGYGAPRPTTREEYVAWPPPGYVPSPLVFPRWSFSFPKANFASSTVTLTSNGVPVALQLGPIVTGKGENTLVWHAADQQTTDATIPPRPLEDAVYEVKIENVQLNGGSRSFSYSVIAFDPDRAGADAVLPELSGPAQPPAGVGSPYSFTAVPVASGHHWLRGRRELVIAVEGAEDGLGALVASTSPGYDPVVTGVKASGTRAFHLAHPMPNTEQTLTFQRRLIPGPGAELQFNEYLGAATSNQTGRVEVSLDDGLTWTSLYSQAGSNGGGFVIFRKTTVPLDSLVGRIIRVRFNYRHDGGLRYDQTDAGVGWHLDDIAFVNTEELNDVVISELADAKSFSFVPDAPGSYVLAVRGEFLDRYPLEWSLPLEVVAVPPPVITFLGGPVIVGNEVQMEFRVLNLTGALSYELLSAPSPAGPWVLEAGATFTTADAGTPFRVSAPRPGQDQRFFHIRGR